VVLVGRRAQRLCEQSEVRHSQRELAATSADRDAVDADQIAEVESDELREASVAQLVDAGVQLQPARAIDEVKERRAAGLPPRGQPSGDAVAGRRLLARLEGDVSSCDVGEGLDAREGVRVWLDPVGAQALELRSPGREEL
jgi:hypothetical protein